jgi:hypothetical protein
MEKEMAGVRNRKLRSIEYENMNSQEEKRKSQDKEMTNQN